MPALHAVRLYWCAECTLQHSSCYGGAQAPVAALGGQALKIRRGLRVLRLRVLGRRVLALTTTKTCHDQHQPLWIGSPQ
jgi:hypothetical protein